MADNPYLRFIQGAKKVRRTLQRLAGLGTEEELSDFDRWVLEGRWQPVTSSTVSQIGYDALNQTVKIEYHGGDRWGYDPIPIALAKGLYYTGSKGTWLWDYVRIRGKGNAKRHQVNARRL